MELFFFIIPDFSIAIFLSDDPNISWWSNPIFVINVINGLTIFVESNLPPNPTSIMANFILCFLKYPKANAKVTSKNEGFILLINVRLFFIKLVI